MTIARIDHLVLATPDLPETVKDFESLTGVEATPGGAHLGLGTRNFLVALGRGTYLEIVGPDLEQDEPERERPFGIDRLKSARLVAWATASTAIEEQVAASRAAGWDPGRVVSMTRRTPAGDLLEWRLTFPRERTPDRGGANIIPFLIDWGATPHPSETSAKGCRLVAFSIQDPDPDGSNRSLEALGLEQRATLGAPRLEARLRTPRGDRVIA